MTTAQAPASAPSTSPPAIPSLNDEQAAAVAAMEAWANDSNSDNRYFLLAGSAGTGKTFCVQQLIRRIKGRMVFTAPTNKATKVLRDSVSREGYQPECKTLYSLLGLRLEANGEIRELAHPEEPIDLSQYRAIVVDEASMVNSNLFRYLNETAVAFDLKVLFMGDSAQLPPVGEKSSEVWSINNGATLKRVMRYDNQILKLATAIRSVVDHPAPTVKLATDNDGEQGIWKLSIMEFERAMLAAASRGEFSSKNGAKAIAWRNARVDTMNKLIRNCIFDRPQAMWLPTDRVIFTAPAKDFEDQTIATTDDEGTVERVTKGQHPIHAGFDCCFLSIQLDDNRVVNARVLAPESQLAYDRKVEELAQAARTNGRKWKAFWDFKESFHSLRHAYAITAHRSQGSTYDTAFVDWQDILTNRSRGEAFRCLYVACTRPKRALVLG